MRAGSENKSRGEDSGTGGAHEMISVIAWPRRRERKRERVQKGRRDEEYKGHQVGSRCSRKELLVKVQVVMATKWAGGKLVQIWTEDRVVARKGKGRGRAPATRLVRKRKEGQTSVHFGRH